LTDYLKDYYNSLVMDTSLKNIDFEPLTEVKAKLSEKVSTVSQKKRLLAITLNGKPTAILISYSEFLNWIQETQQPYIPRRLSLKQWEKEAKQRKAVACLIKNLFDVSKLSRKGQKPYKRNALKKFKKISG